MDPVTRITLQQLLKYLAAGIFVLYMFFVYFWAVGVSERLDELARDNLELRGELESLQYELNRLSSRLGMLESDVSYLYGLSANLEENIVTLYGHVDVLYSYYMSVYQGYNDLYAAVSALDLRMQVCCR